MWTDDDDDDSFGISDGIGVPARAGGGKHRRKHERRKASTDDKNEEWYGSLKAREVRS